MVVIHSSSAHGRVDWDPEWIDFQTAISLGKDKVLGRGSDGEIEWVRLGFNWPLWILFSSGTTGAQPRPGSFPLTYTNRTYVCQADQSEAAIVVNQPAPR